MNTQRDTLTMNALSQLRFFRKLAIRPNVKAPRGAKAMLAKRCFLDRWQAAKLLGTCPSSLSGNVFFVGKSGAVRAFHIFVVGPNAKLP